jgi:hypothetical protein
MNTWHEGGLDTGGAALDVEPLSELSWKRIERGIFSTLERAPASYPDRVSLAHARAPRRTWRLAALGGACAFAAAAAAALWMPNADGPTTPEPSRVVTADSPTEITTGRATLTVAPDSALWVRSGDRGVAVTLERGAVECSVAPDHARPPFVVHAGDVRVEVVGTRFTVARSAQDEVRVTVSRGVVKIIAHGDVWTVSAGESWPAAHAEVSPGASSGGATQRPSRVRHSDKAARRTARAHRNSGALPGAADTADVTADVTADATADTTADTDAAANADARAQYERAAKLEASAPHTAISIYRQLRASGGPWAPLALFAWGRLEAEHGHATAARRLLEQYLHRYPRGPNTADARQLLRDLSR